MPAEGPPPPASGSEGEGVTIPATHRRTSLSFGILNLLVAVILFADFWISGHDSWLLTLLLTFIGLHFLRLGFDARPRFELTAEGIVDRTSMAGGELRLPWKEIAEVTVTPIGGALEVTVQDPTRLWRFAGWPRSIWLRVEGLLGKRTVRLLSGSYPADRSGIRNRMERALLAHERARLGFPPQATRGPGRRE